MKSYTERKLLKEIEWNCRSALSAADDLKAATAGSDDELAAEVVRELALRVQKVAELLWPGKHRLSDHVFVAASPWLRRQVGVNEESPITHSDVVPLYQMLMREDDTDPVVTEPKDAAGLMVRRGPDAYDLEPLLKELKRVWDRSSDLVAGV